MFGEISLNRLAALYLLELAQSGCNCQRPNKIDCQLFPSLQDSSSDKSGIGFDSDIQ